jgi:hypothetical protein
MKCVYPSIHPSCIHRSSVLTLYLSSTITTYPHFLQLHICLPIVTFFFDALLMFDIARSLQFNQTGLKSALSLVTRSTLPGVRFTFALTTGEFVLLCADRTSVMGTDELYPIFVLRVCTFHLFFRSCFG